jgi:hypothetical protein
MNPTVTLSAVDRGARLQSEHGGTVVPVPKNVPLPARRPRTHNVGKVVGHPRQAAIEADLAKGIAARRILKRYATDGDGLSLHVLYRHARSMKVRHPKAFAAMKAEQWQIKPEELEKLRLETGQGWLLQLRTQLSKMILLQDGCLEDGDVTGATQASNQIAKLLEMIGRAVQELSSISTLNVTQTTNNLILSPAYHKVRGALTSALASHPEARAAVLAALRDIENESPRLPQNY